MIRVDVKEDFRSCLFYSVMQENSDEILCSNSVAKWAFSSFIFNSRMGVSRILSLSSFCHMFPFIRWVLYYVIKTMCFAFMIFWPLHWVPELRITFLIILIWLTFVIRGNFWSLKQNLVPVTNLYKAFTIWIRCRSKLGSLLSIVLALLNFFFL